MSFTGLPILNLLLDTECLRQAITPYSPSITRVTGFYKNGRSAWSNQFMHTPFSNPKSVMHDANAGKSFFTVARRDPD